MRDAIPIERLRVSAYTIPTDEPESDGTLEWDRTTLVLVEVDAGGQRGLGFSYGDAAAAHLIDRTLRGELVERDARAITSMWTAMNARVRNLGRPGVASTAISAVDVALWDLKARLCGLPLCELLGSARARVPIYASGGFTSYSIARLQKQLGEWTASGISRVKMKVGREPAKDPERVRAAREAIGAGAELFVDANGAYAPAQARAEAEAFARAGVTWFEEPVSSDDLEGLCAVRARAPAGMEIAAGEYGYDPIYFRRMLQAGAVDVLHADACCAVGRARHVEYFHDHVRIEQLLFDGVLRPKDGALAPDRARPGLGLELKRADARRFAAAGFE